MPSSSSNANSIEFFDTLSLAIHPYGPSFFVGSLDCIKYLQRADVFKSLLVNHHWLVNRIRPKVNIIARVEIKLTNFEAAVKHLAIMPWDFPTYMRTIQ